MKQIIGIIIIISLVSTLSLCGDPIAAEVTPLKKEQCTIPGGAVFGVIHIYLGEVAVFSATDTKITVLNIEKDVPDLKGLKKPRDIALFSLSRDKPVLKEDDGKLYPYHTYGHQLLVDFGFVFYDILKDCHTN